MAKTILPLPSFCTILLLFLFNSGVILKLAKGQAPGQAAWCVAKASSTEQELRDNINYACSFVDCSIIERGGACFSPETLINHASVAMNLYYQKEGRNFWNCDFIKSGIIAVTDPSYGNCKYWYAQ